jgi:hypothetical protein
MRVDFELIVRNAVPDEMIAFALATAYRVAVDSVEVQDMADPSPIRKTTKIWCRRDTVQGQFSTFLLIYLCGITNELEFLDVAASVSQTLGCDCLAPDDDSPVASSMVLLRGFAPPQKVELVDDEDEDSNETIYTIKNLSFEILQRKDRK